MTNIEIKHKQTKVLGGVYLNDKNNLTLQKMWRYVHEKFDPRGRKKLKDQSVKKWGYKELQSVVGRERDR